MSPIPRMKEEKEFLDEAITAFKNNDKNIFVKNLTLIFTNRTLPQREVLFTTIYEELKKENEQ